MNNKLSNLAEVTRKDFPMFINNEAIYLDHAATSQKPKIVIETLENYYKNQNANVHRGAHSLSMKATELFENARKITAKFIGASDSKEIIFTRNATEAINLVALTWGNQNLTKDDEVLLSVMEHHSNLVPWQLISNRTGCKLRYININESGELDFKNFLEQINDRTKIVSLVHISNTLGCCNPIEEIAKVCKKYNSLFLLDACQSLAHQKIDVKKLDIDFLAGSAHKLCGPTGIGFLWGREEILEKMPPFLGGGEMIEDVFLDKSTWADIPHKFEAGTPAIGEAIAMGSALNYLDDIGLDRIKGWELDLTKYLFECLKTINRINILGPDPNIKISRGALATFHVDGISSDDVSTLINESNIYIRSGHHCCQPLHRLYQIKSTARASLSFTSTMSEINTFTNELKSVINFLIKNS
tara:strand:- start:15727 stop:16968 length:1242 start_codon:yes stop_codon:yes gene_type:complete